MASVNKVILLGNLTHDPEVRQTSGGTVVCSLRMATNTRNREPDFHRITVWNSERRKLADLCSQHLRKGSQLCVEGELRSRSWTDSSGATKHTVEVNAFDVQFLGSPATQDDDQDDIPFA